jgi:hypothetical protein
MQDFFMVQNTEKKLPGVWDVCRIKEADCVL